MDTLTRIRAFIDVVDAEGFSAALAAPEVRAERVDALKAKIAAGDYQIDARNIAEKMLKEDADLFE